MANGTELEGLGDPFGPGSKGIPKPEVEPKDPTGGIEQVPEGKYPPGILTDGACGEAKYRKLYEAVHCALDIIPTASTQQPNKLPQHLIDDINEALLDSKYPCGGALLETWCDAHPDEPIASAIPGLKGIGICPKMWTELTSHPTPLAALCGTLAHEATHVAGYGPEDRPKQVEDAVFDTANSLGFAQFGDWLATFNDEEGTTTKKDQWASRFGGQTLEPIKPPS